MEWKQFHILGGVGGKGTPIYELYGCVLLIRLGFQSLAGTLTLKISQSTPMALEHETAISYQQPAITF